MKPFRTFGLCGPGVMHHAMAMSEYEARGQKRRTATPDSDSHVGLDVEEHFKSVAYLVEKSFCERLVVISAVQAMLANKTVLAVGSLCGLRVEPVFPRPDSDGWILKFEIVRRASETVLVAAVTKPFQKERESILEFSCPLNMPTETSLDLKSKRDFMAKVACLANEILKTTTLRVM